jgi:Domain of unknown function (DUF4259)
MGAWGHGSFENDSALDWVENAFKPGGAAAVESALRYAAESTEDVYLDIDEASAVVAAAEFVAAAKDGDLSKLGPTQNDFATHRQSLTSPHLLPLARRALQRVLRKSELQELWTEGQDKSWLNEMTNLLARLR